MRTVLLGTAVQCAAEMLQGRPEAGSLYTREKSCSFIEQDWCFVEPTRFRVNNGVLNHQKLKDLPRFLPPC